MTNTDLKNKKQNGKILKGKVVSDKMQKTIVVEVSHFVKHPKYEKFFKKAKRYKVHDEENKHKVGEIIEIRETRPLSRHKSFVVID